MKITKKQLNELLRLITRGVMKEYGSLGSSLANDGSGDAGIADDGVKPQDAMTAAEKSKAEREARQAQAAKVKQDQRKLDGDKAQDKYFEKQRQVNRVSIRAQEKNIQKEKGARISSSPSAPLSSPLS
jgi:hypothetical protein